MVNIVYQYRYFRQDVILNPSALYVFGDNALRVGYAGQAEACRGLANAHGIATLLQPGKYFQDKHYEQVIALVGRDLDGLADAINTGAFHTLVFPIDGVGTGLARMKEHAPHSYDYMCGQLEQRFGIVNNISRMYRHGLIGRELGAAIVDEVGYEPRGIPKADS